MKKVRSIMTAFVVFMLQSAVLPFWFDGVTQPNLIFVFVVLMALRYGQKAGLWTAVLGGLCQDVIIGNFFGIHLLTYILIAMICSRMGKHVEPSQWQLVLLIVLGATEVCLLLYGAVIFMSGQFIHVMAYLVEFSIPMLVYHGIIAIPVDCAVRKLRRDDAFYGLGMVGKWR